MIKNDEQLYLLIPKNEKFLKELMSRYYSELCNYYEMITDDSIYTEDCVSKIFYSLWEKAQDGKKISNIKAYLYISVRNAALESNRKKFKTTPTDDIYQLEKYINNNADDFAIHLSEELQKVIKDLPPQQQEAFVLKRYQGMKYNEIAETMDISSSMVKKHLSRAMDKLKEKSKWIMSKVLEEGPY